MFDVVVVGSSNLDLVATTQRLPGPGETVLGSSYVEHPGGKGLNQAVAAARSGANVAMVGAVGDDAAGDRLRTVAQAEQIDVGTLAVIDGAATGRALIIVDEHAENSIVVVAGANDRVHAHSFPDATVVLAQLEIPLETVLDAFRTARTRGALTILNPAPARPLPDALLEVCDVVVPNEHELGLIGGTRWLTDRGVGTVVTTKAAAGVTVTVAGHPGSTEWSQPAFAVTAVDSTGAGDAFCGALAARLAAGDDMRTAVAFAAAAGALATTVHGAVPSLPRSVAVRGLLAGAG